MNATVNRLGREKSPYLLQHAHNPVDWFPWGEEAFRRAKEEDKPIFLSIGYATCHWCHVMERESFEDPEVGRVMNQTFVCIKVDREERPDVDKVYMTACTLMTGRGGWPLNVLLAPDKAPFFAGTYIPRSSRFGYPGLLDLATQVQTLWREQRGDILASARNVLASLRLASQEDAPASGNAATAIDAETFKAAYRAFADSFDEEYSGFGQAPKFPSLHNLLFLLGVYEQFAYPRALEMVEKTLAALRNGGIFDQLGFGLHRYATDRAWLVPHFEKMLYDQAMLLMTCAAAYRVNGKESIRQTAEDLVVYLLRDMQSPDGAFYTAEDADSEGVEGKFYVFTTDEILALLGEQDGALALAWFNCELGGNFEDEATKEKTGANILHVRGERPTFAQKQDLALEELDARLEAIRLKLLAARSLRVPPLKDDKTLADWNGLMIAALALAAASFQRPEWTAAAARAARFALARLRAPDGALVHRFRDGEAGLPAHLDDYAFLAWGLIELAEAAHEAAEAAEWRVAAVELVETLLARFWDQRNAGFYFTAEDQTELPVRPKELYDNAIPSGNAVALMVLARLGVSGARPDYLERTRAMRRAFAPAVAKAPAAYAFLLYAAMQMDAAP